MTLENKDLKHPVRIQKLLASWGVASRRAVEKLISAGRVCVNGILVTELGLKVIPACCSIEVDGFEIVAPILHEPYIIALHKPLGVASTLYDPFQKRTLADLFPKDRRLFPIGRLDLDSTGLLLATNHGELTNRLLHPKFKIEKEYNVKFLGQPLSPKEEKSFIEGLNLEDGLTAPCFLAGISGGEYRVVLREGRKRQIRRMFKMLGREVISLHRTRFGPILLGKLKSGICRELTSLETKELFSVAGLSEENV